MTSALALALRRAQQGDRFAAGHTLRECIDRFTLARNLAEVAAAIRRPGEFHAALAVGGRVKLLARAEVGLPLAPSLVSFRDAAGAIAAHEDAGAVGGIDRIVPALGANLSHREW